MGIRFIATLCFVVLLAAPAQAGNTITKQMVAEKYSQMENLLNDRSQIVRAIRFMHNHIGENARFNITVNNPLITGAVKDQQMTIDKAGYINSYVQGGNFVEGYNLDIKTVEFEYRPDVNAAFSKEVYTERGVAKDPMQLFQGQGRAFISRTTCQTRHEMNNGVLMSTGSSCHTDVSFEEEI